MGDSPEEILRDIAAIGRIDAVPVLLRVLCESTGMGFAAVARVTEGTWIACAVQDDIEFGMKPGGHLEIHSTLCKEVRASRQPIVIAHASVDPVYCTHHTPLRYGLESYISVPIVLAGGDYFGNLCAIDPRPAKISEPRIESMFVLFAQLIALHLENERKHEQQAALLDERAAGELREQFIAILGHDLRNPLAAVAACGDLLQHTANDRFRSTLLRISSEVLSACRR
ncbi:MAG: histidine kinase [Verrucomicrobiaceae bacterium]|nr:histidine kinase [Verrucomicrobiaceae bacterium]